MPSMLRFLLKFLTDKHWGAEIFVKNQHTKCYEKEIFDLIFLYILIV